MHKCLLCSQNDHLLNFFKNSQGIQFLKCTACGFIFKAPEHHPSLTDQKTRYQLHQNDVLDPHYQNFLKPVVEAVLSQQNPEDLGMDYGCGSSSAIEYLLKEKNYPISLYDPVFFPDPKIFLNLYDYITCTEVIEHFTEPALEFKKLRQLLKPNGKLYVKTALTDSVSDFPNWYYHRDITHVGFYNKQSLEFIVTEYGFSNLQIRDDYFILMSQ